MLTLLRDITGGRRFWPVKTPGDTKLKPWDIDDVDQIWAEVMEYYHQGESLILSNKAEEFANAAQVDALESDDREGLVREYLDMRLPSNWDDMDLYARRSFIRGDEFSEDAIRNCKKRASLHHEVSKVLVIAPLRVAESTWDEEAAKWDHLKHLKISKVLGTEKERINALYRKADIYIINRENVKWLVDKCGKDWPFDMVVIDELSSFKSHRAQRFKALKKVRPFMKRVVGLTGTPAPNGLIDLWSQIYLLDGGERLGKTITT
ncbi:VapE domain-containing protein [Anaerosalibacter bizertensis]|nr:SNF2-related protein [Anaerosalibacter bizertensis]